jgi:hypothetical protein
VDENCLIFTREEENRFEYTTIHKQFKVMLCSLFDTMMQELGITDQACEEAVKAGLANPRHRSVFHQLVIANDFLAFKNIMIKRNEQFEAEALQELQKQAQAQEVQPAGMT